MRVLDAVASSRRRLSETAEHLAALRRSAEGLSDRAQWQSVAARHFSRDADAFAGDLATLAAQIDGLDDDLRGAAARAVRWACS